jgi:hypothetical protein
VTITGTGFSSVGEITFGGTTAASYVVDSATSITAVSPANSGPPGTVDVKVTTNNGTSATSAADQFTYTGTVPTVTGVSPNSGPTAGGTTVIVIGTNFTAATSVMFGGTAAPTFSVNQGPVPAAGTVITATSPPGAGTVDVTVVAPGGTSTTSAADQFNYTAGPTVTAVSPNSGPVTGNTSVTITGANFNSVSAVAFGHNAAVSFTVNSPTSITATSPAGTGTVNVTVTTPLGTSATSVGDQFTYGGSTAVTSVSPNAGPPGGGTSVTITGTNFTGATAVAFGSNPASSFTVNSATSITAASPAGSGTVNVTVTTPGGTSVTSVASLFAYSSGGPTVTAVSPNTGPPGGGTSVTITGTNFTGATAVSFAGNAANSFTVNSATSITATSPAGTGTVDVTVATPGGTSGTSSADQFFYSKATTTLTLSSSPNPSTVGQLVTFTAKVTGNSPTGTVTFLDGTTQIGTATLSAGIATFAIASLSAGSHSITASYPGDANNAPDPVTLIQVVSVSSDSIKLREMQISTMPIVAQMSGQAITGAVDSAIGVALGGSPPAIMPNGSGFTYYLDAAPQPTHTATSDSGTRGAAIDGDFAALGYAPHRAAPPTPYALPAPPPKPSYSPPPRDWLAWVDVRGVDFDQTTVGSDLKGLQANVTAGLTHILTRDIVVGLLAGYEHFDFTSQAFNAVLTGNGFTAGTYAAWRFAPTLRLDAAMAWSDVFAADTSGSASGNFNAYRWLASGGLTGDYNWGALMVEPSARIYSLWEQDSGYTDSLGTPQAARDFDTSRSSGGVKASYRFVAGSVSLTPYVGLYGDYYFSKDTATTAELTTVPIIQGWAARTTAGLVTTFASGSQFTVGGEFSGLGSDIDFWTLSVRGSVPF